ncbi:TetR/AcrR family transcriptional regulator [Egibacter rhizosphaerae]|uniref:TetR/AcrR family transcriptional regulator n=1 Tax=Egibacter rhizosphaerae TaxID=1670831 RepID=A0A411YFC5_9ACTN|nr:TetR/AcrR family transcriptional regulator [Egibacter rhizosphaerae]QBI19886.1 TetR/AcrR family transcriptional regulator [Egibacter rhizosphaerae]
MAVQEPAGTDPAPAAVRVDPRIARSRAVIVEAATAHYLAHGYREANLDDVAREARVSKRTIYNVIGGKEQLFRAVLAEAIDTAERFSVEVAAGIGDTDDVATELGGVASTLAASVLGGRIVSLRRLLIAEATRFPELARDYYERAPGRVMTTLADGLARLAARGLLDIDDAELAAEHLAFLVLGASLDRALFEADAPSATTVETRARAGVEVFLRAYACRP